ncbi:hypothetical protein BHF71_10790 [Vulcanibacillus modesticaldus]|uniref:Uncharacterized protein n=1 Tax=Vulcanibacillus modesticaldus TaxID=337097 RepID=A0A1D2YT29_9BACI|nr:hypothetical protein [Vulcanibacillus modesticaldus]OEF98829.1 hypothetical protein BHF71_10790 [Vulcanibacillus modesticaldus]
MSNGTKRKIKKLILIAIAVVILSFSIFVEDMAGYLYIKNTSTQLEIDPYGTKWEDRIIVKDDELINKVMTYIRSSIPLETNITKKCDYERFKSEGKNNLLHIIIRRNFAKDDLSWIICSDGSNTFLVPTMGINSKLNNNVEYISDMQLMSVLQKIIKKYE